MPAKTEPTFVLGIPEGRIGEEDSGLVCKRKREGKVNGTTEEEARKKRTGNGQLGDGGGGQR